MLGRIIFPVIFVIASIVAVFGVLSYTQDPQAGMVTAGVDTGGAPADLSAAAITAFQKIAAVFAPALEAEPAALAIDDLAAPDAIAAGIVPEQSVSVQSVAGQEDVMVPSTPFVRRAGAADATASNPTTCAIEAGVRRCRVVN